MSTPTNSPLPLSPPPNFPDNTSPPPFPSTITPLAPIALISHADLLALSSSAINSITSACRTYGFFYLDLTTTPSGRALHEQAHALRTLAESAFALPLAAKLDHRLIPNGVSLFGYKPAGTVKLTDPTAKRDTTEFFNLSKDHAHGIAPARSYPPVVADAMPLVRDFTAAAHETGMQILRALARGLDMADDEVFVRLNAFGKPSGDHARLTRKFGRGSSDAADDGANTVGLPSHTDFGSVTLLWNWLGGLQIEDVSKEGEGHWAWVKPLPNCAVINLGDAMVRFTNGELRSAKHRVVPAPGEQGRWDRVSVVYFVRPCDESLMLPVGKFALLEEGKAVENGEGKGGEEEGQRGKRLKGLVRVAGKLKVEEDRVYTAGEWMSLRAKQMGS